MCEFTAAAAQTVNPGETVVFTETSLQCNRGFVRHRDDTGNFLLAGYAPNNQNRSCQCCNARRLANYLVEFGANIAIPTGGTVGEIALAFSVDGATVPATAMRVTPAAVEEYFNVNCARSIDVWKGCCESLSVRNIGAEPILVQEANIVISRPDLYLSM